MHLAFFIELNLFCQIFYRLVEEKENNEIEELPVVKNLSMILEASKERNSSSLTSNNTKLEQLSAIELGKIFSINHLKLYLCLMN